MAFADITLAPVASYTAGGSMTFENISPGNFLNSNTTSLTPQYLRISPKISDGPEAISNFMVRLDTTSDLIGTKPGNETRSLWVVGKGPFPYISASQFLSDLGIIYGFLAANSGANLAKVMRGNK